MKHRLDTLLVERGLVESREKAQALILAGEVTVNSKTVTKAGTAVAEDAAIELRQKMPFVGRGGFKLEHALNCFQIDVTSKAALDVGASTGGFTDCLLQRGASRVYALDVGYGQLDYRLRSDPRVVVMDRVNAHYPFNLPEKIDLATMDLSFISVEKVLPNVTPWVKDGGDIIVLFKPQFEAQRKQVGKGGLVKDPSLHASILGRFIAWIVSHNLRLRGLTPSPIRGGSGNREFLLWLKPDGSNL